MDMTDPPVLWPWRRVASLALPISLVVAACDTFAPGGPSEDQLLDGFIDGMSPSQIESHLIGDEEDVMVVQLLLHGPEEAIWRNRESANALDRLGDHRGHIA